MRPDARFGNLSKTNAHFSSSNDHKYFTSDIKNNRKNISFGNLVSLKSADFLLSKGSTLYSPVIINFGVFQKFAIDGTYGINGKLDVARRHFERNKLAITFTDYLYIIVSRNWTRIKNHRNKIEILLVLL